MVYDQALKMRINPYWIYHPFLTPYNDHHFVLYCFFLVRIQTLQLEEFEEFLDPYANGLPDEIQQELTDRYEELFRIFYNKKDKIDRVTFWGVHDGMSWKNGYPIPGRTNYTLLYNRKKQPKPALSAILDVPKNR